ncbi:hypothetical protein PVAP13_1KG003801 [Panicum virgatum]|uniref:Uncharacterized protein n=1 Tax=Panicum virgatum TaxID=38727 RepID=A0A8T0XDD1_PANVG|nr:hypothetical protein PVAP13_1KG003801 [Panicum virgatum]
MLLRLQRMSSRSLGVLWSSLTYCNHLINLFGGEASRVLYWLWLGKTKEGQPTMRDLLYLFWQFCEQAVRWEGAC